jgi:hypothetical protein
MIVRLLPSFETLFPKTPQARKNHFVDTAPDAASLCSGVDHANTIPPGIQGVYLALAFMLVLSRQSEPPA